jgi:AcrR family transcriptional regulator
MDHDHAGRKRISPEIRRAVHESRESTSSLARRYGLNPKTVRRWRGRTSPEDRKPGPQPMSSGRLRPETEASLLALRLLTALPLDDCHYALSDQVEGVSRSSVFRLLRQNGLSPLPPTATPPRERPTFELHALSLASDGEGPMLILAVEPVSRFIAASLAEDWGAVLRSLPPGVDGVSAPKRLPASARAQLRAGCRAAGLRLHANATRELTVELEILRPSVLAVLAQDGPARFRARLRRALSRYNRRCRLKALGGRTPAGQFAKLERSTAPAARRAAKGRRDNILAAARALLARGGTESLTVSAVARAVGVSRGAIHKQFGSREDLIAETARWSSAQLKRSVFGDEPDPASADPRSTEVGKVARGLADFGIANPEICRAWLFQLLSAPDPAQDEFWREYVARAARFHETPLAAPDIDAEVLSVIILAGAFLWPMWAHGKARSAAELPVFGERFARELLRLAVHGTVRREYFDAFPRGAPSS